MAKFAFLVFNAISKATFIQLFYYVDIGFGWNK